LYEYEHEYGGGDTMSDCILVQIPRLTEYLSRCRSTFNKPALPNASGKFAPVCFYRMA